MFQLAPHLPLLFCPLFPPTAMLSCFSLRPSLPPLQISAPSLFLHPSPYFWSETHWLAWRWFSFPALERLHARTLSTLCPPCLPYFTLLKQDFISAHTLSPLPPNDPTARGGRVTRDSQPAHTQPTEIWIKITFPVMHRLSNYS